MNQEQFLYPTAVGTNEMTVGHAVPSCMGLELRGLPCGCWGCLDAREGSVHNQNVFAGIKHMVITKSRHITATTEKDPLK